MTVTDSGAPALSASTTVTVNLNDTDDSSPTYWLGVLSQSVTALLNSGSLTSSQADNLQAKLDVIARKLEQGNTNAALNNLNSFMNQVIGLVSQGEITQAEGDVLLNAANSLKLAIQG